MYVCVIRIIVYIWTRQISMRFFRVLHPWLAYLTVSLANIYRGQSPDLANIARVLFFCIF